MTLPAARRPLRWPGPRVLFVGAGPGAADLLTFRGAAAIMAADVVVWAASLVSEEVLAHARPRTQIVDSSVLALGEILAVYERAAAHSHIVTRVHSGDPSLYGAIQEQIEFCDEHEIPWEIVPGVSSLGAAAAAIGRELTIPEVAQSVVVTRIGGRTPMPARESVRFFAAHRTTMALFLSASRPKRVQEELLAGGYPPDTPCAVVYRASWPDELVIRCRLDELARRMRSARIHKTAIVLVSPALESRSTRSQLYDPSFSHEFRRADKGPARAPA